MTYYIHGHVQGVFFRQSTAELACKLSITGTVRNLSDGGVEVVAEGNIKEMDQLRDYLIHGPKYAKVDRIRGHASESEGHCGFQIIK